MSSSSGHGKAWEEFERQVADVFRLMGYDVTTDTRLDSAQTDIVATAPTRLKPNLIIECKHHENPKRRVNGDEIENFCARVQLLRTDGVVDYGYLVTNTGFTSFARGATSQRAVGNYVFLRTYESLFGDLVETGTYLNAFVGTYEGSIESSRFVELGVVNAVATGRQALGPDAAGEIISEEDAGYERSGREVDASTPLRYPPQGRQLMKWLPRGLLGRVIPMAGVARPVDVEGSTRSDIALGFFTFHYVTPNATDVVPFEQYVDVFLENPTERLLLLLGDFGSGKTTVLRHLMYSLAKRRLQATNPSGHRVPLLIDLRHFNQRNDFDAVLEDVLKRELGAANLNLAAFKAMNARGLFVLVLDAFDEMAQLGTPAERRATFQFLCEQVTGGSKVVLSGRPGYFPTVGEMVEALRPLFVVQPATPTRQSAGASVNVAALQLMSTSQVNRFLALAFTNQDEMLARSLELLRNERIAELAQRPVLAGMIVESVDELSNKRPEEVHLRSLYEVYTDKWIKRDESGKGFVRILVDPKRKRDFMCLLASQMHKAGVQEIHYQDLDQRIEKHFGITTGAQLEQLSYDIRTCSFLSWSSEDGRYRFIHRSFLDYFAAEEYCQFDASSMPAPFGRLSDEMLEFMVGRTLPSGLVMLLDARDALRDLERFSSSQQRYERAVAFSAFSMKAEDAIQRAWPLFKAAQIREFLARLGREIAPILNDLEDEPISHRRAPSEIVRRTREAVTAQLDEESEAGRGGGALWSGLDEIAPPY